MAQKMAVPRVATRAETTVALRAVRWVVNSVGQKAALLAVHWVAPKAEQMVELSEQRWVVLTVDPRAVLKAVTMADLWVVHWADSRAACWVESSAVRSAGNLVATLGLMKVVLRAVQSVDLTVAPRAALKAVRWVAQTAACSADLWVASRAEN